MIALKRVIATLRTALLFLILLAVFAPIIRLIIELWLQMPKG